MKKSLLLLFILHSTFCIFHSADAQVTYQKTYGGTGTSAAACIKQTADGGYIFSGTTDSLGAGGNDFYLVKTTWAGDTVWTKTYGGSGNESSPYVEQTSDGGYVLAGTSASFGAGADDMLIIKTSSTGGLQWAKTIGGAGSDEAFVIHEISGGGYIVGGWTSGFGAGGFDAYVAKLNSSGSFVWAKTYGTSGDEFCTDIQQTADGGFVMTGTINSYFTGDSTDVYVIKTDSSGAIAWSKRIGSNKGDYANCIIQTMDGGYAIGGLIDKGSPQYDNVLLIKLDVSGAVSFSKNYNHGVTETCNSIKETAGGNFILAGQTVGTASSLDAYLVKTDNAGAVLFAKNYGGTDVENASYVSIANDGGYIIAGYTSSFGAAGQSAYITRTDTAGNSGCNQAAATVTVATLTLTASSVATAVASAGNAADAAPVISGGGTVVVICYAIGIDEVNDASSALSIYPNPATDDFTVSLTGLPSGKTSAFLQILDIAGRCVYEKEIRISKLEISAANFSAGIYFVKVSDGERSETKKLIIQ
jgi:hypothetical protein